MTNRESKSMPDWIASSLSREQRRPVARTTGNACILAAAGSGKTRTLVHLLAADLASGIPASGIVAFTFTEKAAEELLARIHILAKMYLADLDLTGMCVGTIHAWCLQYLLAQSEFYDLTPLDELQLDALVSRLYDTLQLERAYGQPYPRAIGKFLADIEVFYNEHLTLEQAPPNIAPSIAVFLDTLQQNRLVTFGGMIRYAIEHLRANGPVLGLQSLCVDEYQDVNPAQVALIKAMLPADARVVVVGDELQCIYNWRGSDVARILKFSDEFDKVSVFRLSTNYRARPSIVTLAKKIGEDIELRDPKRVMKPGRSSAHCKPIHWLSLDAEQEQVEAAVDIAEKFAAQGVPWNQMAVLLRSVVSWGKPFVDALTARDIPVQCPILSRGGQFINEFLLPVFDWLRRQHDEPKNEIEEAETEEAAGALWESVRKWIPVANAEVVFWEAMNDWLDAIEEARNDTYDVRGRLYGFLDRCGIRIAPHDYNLMVGLGIASQIIRSVEEIQRRRLQGQQRPSPRNVMSEVYFALRRNYQDFGESVPINTAADAVLVSTVHQAKGLEWPIVIIPMMVDRRFPVSLRSHDSSFPPEIAGRYGTSLEDERRLFYVAATRPKERLFLLDPLRQKEHKRSVFLKDLQDKHIIEPTSPSQIHPAVWRLAKEDLKDTDPPPLRVGVSDLLIYVECPYQFGLRRMAGVRPSVGDELGFGKGLHVLLRRRFEANHEWPLEQLREQVNRYVSLPYMPEQGEAQSRLAIERRIKTLEKLGVFGVEVESEVAVDVVLDGGIVHGVIDGVQVNGDGSVSVRDWKSNIHEAFVPRYERQLQFYAYALRLRGRTVSKAEMVDVAATHEQESLVAREVDISRSAVVHLVDALNLSLKGIAASDFPPNPSASSCACCDVSKICSERYTDDPTYEA